VNKVIRWAAPVAMLVAAGTFGIATVGAGSASAGKHLGSSPVVHNGVQPNFSPLKGKLLTTRVVGNGVSGALTGAGTFNNVDAPQSFNCPATKAPCTVEGDMNVQVDSGANGTNAGWWAICLLVDGSAISLCPYIDAGAANGGFETSTQIGYVGSLGAGTHTVQTQVYTSNAVYVYTYNITYHVYV
jgi:hypothetical protein